MGKLFREHSLAGGRAISYGLCLALAYLSGSEIRKLRETGYKDFQLNSELFPACIEDYLLD